MRRHFTFVLLALAGFGVAQSPPPPKLAALSAIIVDAETGTVLYSKNADLKLHPASTTKIMTGMLLAERCRPEDVLTAPFDISKVKESSMHLMPGEQVTAEEMLYALMLRSANDGCHTVAVHLAGSDAEFAKLMNEKAKSLGCLNTNFVNPHGLTDPNHLTTARDLSMMARAAMKDPVFAKVVGTQKHVLKRSLNLKDTLLVNRDKWLAIEPRAKGVKTGWTKPAGHCFVGCASDGNIKVVTALLKSDKWLDDQKAMTAWVFDNFERRQLVKKGEKLGAVKVLEGDKLEVGAVATEGVWALVPKTSSPGFTLDWQQTPAEAPVQFGQSMGSADLVLDSGDRIALKLAADKEVKKPVLFNSIMSPGGLIGFGALFGGALLLRARSRRWSKDIHLR